MLKINILFKKYAKQIVISVILMAIVAIFYFFDPSESSYFIKCPLKAVSGYDCPGCGVQRAVHELLHFRILEAFKYNALFVISLPFCVFILMVHFFGRETMKRTVKRFFTHRISVFLVLIIVFVFLVLKNTDLNKEFLFKL